MWPDGLMGAVRFWSRIWPWVKAENVGSKFLTLVAGGSIESIQPTSPCNFAISLLLGILYLFVVRQMHL